MENLELGTASQKTDNTDARGACAFKHLYSKFHNAALKYFHAVFILHNAALTLIHHHKILVTLISPWLHLCQKSDSCSPPIS